MTLNELDLLNAEELLELARDNVLATDGYNFSEIVIKVANHQYEAGYALAWAHSGADVDGTDDYA